jgi:predicted permease
VIRGLQETLSRLGSVFRRSRLDKDFEDEFAAHIDLLTEQNENRGLPHDEARRQAILQMGGLNTTKDLQREARGLPWFDRFLDVLRIFAHDLVHAIRSLAKARAFTFVCVASLGIGMGTVIGILIFLRTFGPPAGFNPNGIVEVLVEPQGRLREEVGPESIETWSYPDYMAVRDANTGITVTGWTTGETVFRQPQGATEVASAMWVSANYFRTMGVTLRGHGFDDIVDENSAAPPSVIIGEDFWNDRLASDPGILGKIILLDRVPHVVVGISPDQFDTHMNAESSPEADVWLPLRQHPRLRADESLRFNRAVDWIRMHGRLSPGVSVERANAAVAGLMSGLAAQYPASNQFKAASVEPYLAMGARRRDNFARLQTIFLSAAGVVLLVVCLNISGMMLVRSAMRERELSIRQAVGAARGQLIRYLLSEALVLATLAGSLAAALLIGVPSVFSWWVGEPIPGPFRPDPAMIAMCAGLCLITSLTFGLMPALRFSRPSLTTALKDDVGGGRRQVGRVHRLAAAVQVGLAVPFLVFSGVLLDHVRTAANAELGFEPNGLLAAPLHLAGVANTDEDAASLLRTAREKLAGTSGVASAGVADALPLDFRSRVLWISRLDDKTPFGVRPTRVDDGYLRTMGIRLVRGRGFTAEDRAGANPVAMITEPVALQLFPDKDALGEQITFTLEDKTTKVVTIVGVAGDFVGSQMSNPRPQMLLPLAQHPVSSVFLVARSANGNGLAALAPTFREALRDLNPQFDPTAIVTGEKLVKESNEDILGQSALNLVGGGVALTLAALGVYGVIGFAVAMRTREIAVRIALGASQRRVLGTIVTDIVKLVAPGVIFGLLIAATVVRNSYLSWSQFSQDWAQPAAQPQSSRSWPCDRNRRSKWFAAFRKHFPGYSRYFAAEPWIRISTKSSRPTSIC